MKSIETVKKNNETAFNAFKRARTFNSYNVKTNASEQFTIIAESDTHYRTVDNKLIKKETYEKKALKNTIDYRYNYDMEADAKFEQIQKKLCIVLEISENSDIRAFENIFEVRQTKRYYNILTSDSVILNRASSIELLLTETDTDKLTAYKENIVEVSETESKKQKYFSHVKNSKCFSLILKTKTDIETVATILRSNTALATI